MLQGQIESLEQRGTTSVALVNCGAPFTVHLTLSATRALELAAGKHVWLVLKTHSCHLVND